MSKVNQRPNKPTASEHVHRECALVAFVAFVAFVVGLWSAQDVSDHFLHNTSSGARTGLVRCVVAFAVCNVCTLVWCGLRSSLQCTTATT